MMDRRSWMLDWRLQYLDHARQLYDSVGFLPPAGTDPRAEPRMEYQHHGVGNRGSRPSPRDTLDLNDRPPYPMTPQMPRMVLASSQAPRIIEPEVCLSGSIPTPEPTPYRHTLQIVRPARNSRSWHTLVSALHQSSAQHSRPSGRLATDRAEYLIVKPLLAGSLRYTNHDIDHLLIQNVETAEIFVQKRWNDSTYLSRRRAAVESSALRQIMYAGPSPHIVGILESFYEPSASCFILEYCDSGNLGDYIDRNIEQSRFAPEAFAWHVLSSLASALCVCHYGTSDANQSLVAAQSWTTLYHFDIQPVNIWLSSRGTVSAYPRVVLGNFSCVCRRAELESGEADDALQRYGTPAWLPPEARNRHSAVLGKYTDIWQVGAVIQAMCCLTRIQGTTEVEKPYGSPYSLALNNMVSCCMNGGLDE